MDFRMVWLFLVLSKTFQSPLGEDCLAIRFGKTFHLEKKVLENHKTLTVVKVPGFLQMFLFQQTFLFLDLLVYNELVLDGPFDQVFSQFQSYSLQATHLCLPQSLAFLSWCKLFSLQTKPLCFEPLFLVQLKWSISLDALGIPLCP